jgi:hypothetical protein
MIGPQIRAMAGNARSEVMMAARRNYGWCHWTEDFLLFTSLAGRLLLRAR